MVKVRANRQTLIEQAMRIVEDDEDTGLCTKCGAEQDSVEPDAEGYECHTCGEMSVMGAENILIRWG